MDEELIKSYSGYLESMSETKTVRQFARYFLRCLLRWLSSQNLSLFEFNAAVANDFLCSFKSAGHPPPTVNSAFYHLRLFGIYAVRYGLITADPTEGLSLHWLDIPGGYPAYRGALRKIFERPAEAFAYRLPRFAPYWELYLRHLLDQNYDIGSIRNIASDNRAFHQWLADRKIVLTKVTPSFLDGYIRHLHSEFQKRTKLAMTPKVARDTRNFIESFLTFVFRQQNRHFRKPQVQPDSSVLPNKLLDDYANFCRDHGGIKELTLKIRRRKLLGFRAFLEDRGIRRLGEVTIKTMDDFFQGLSRRMNGHSLGAIISTARSFFRFLYLHGKYPSDLARDMVPPCRFSADRRPKYLPWSKIQSLLDSIDRSSRQGKRDFAMAAVLAHHGLRPKEVADLQLADIDWERSTLLLSQRKNNTCVRFPLSPIAKAAIRDYLAVRPNTSLTQIFLTLKAPLKPLGASSIGSVITRYVRRHFGISLRCYGPYLLRHSFAKALLDRGAMLTEVSLLLGHKRLQNTFIYSRINTKDLSEVADNYANLLDF